MELVDKSELSYLMEYVSRTTEDMTRLKDGLLLMYRWLREGVPAIEYDFHDKELKDAYSLLADGMKGTREYIDGMIQREKNCCVGCMYGKRSVDGYSCLKGYDTTIVCNDYLPNR